MQRNKRPKGANCGWWQGGKQISGGLKTRALGRNNEKGEMGLVKWGEEGAEEWGQKVRGPESQMKAFGVNTKGSGGAGAEEGFDENPVWED